MEKPGFRLRPLARRIDDVVATRCSDISIVGYRDRCCRSLVRDGKDVAADCFRNKSVRLEIDGRVLIECHWPGSQRHRRPDVLIAPRTRGQILDLVIHGCRREDHLVGITLGQGLKSRGLNGPLRHRHRAIQPVVVHSGFHLRNRHRCKDEADKHGHDDLNQRVTSAFVRPKGLQLPVVSLF